MNAWIVLCLVTAVAALSLQLVGMHSLERRNRMLRSQLDALEGLLSLQAQSIGGLTSGTQGVDRRLACLEAREQVLSQRQDTFESQQADERPYHQAIRLVQQGAGSRRLIEEFELSESEAALIVRLHGETPPAQTAEI